MVPACKKTNWWVVGLSSVQSLVLLYSSAFAEDIYKVVGEDGKVTYSTEPLEADQSAEIIRAMPEPPEEDVADARRRQQKIEQAFDKLDQARAEQARYEAQQRANTTTTVIQSNTVLGTSPWYRHPYGYWRGAHVAPGAPTAPGFRSPHYRRPIHGPRASVALGHRSKLKRSSRQRLSIKP